MNPQEFEEIAQALDVVRSETKAPVGCFANALRRYVQGMNWPPTFYTNPAYRAQLRLLLRALELKPRENEEMVAQSVQLCDLVSSPHAMRLTWQQAFTGEPGGGGLFPPTAPPAPSNERQRREYLFPRRWVAHHLLTLGLEADDASVEDFLKSDEYRRAVAERVTAFYGRRRESQPSVIDEHPPAFADHCHWALKPSFRLAELSAMAWQEGWHFNSVTPKQDSRPGEFTWTPLDEASTIRYCESAIIKARYVYVTGRDERALLAKLARLDVFQPSELVELARHEPDPVVRRGYIVKLGIAATPRGVLAKEKREPEADVLAYLADSMGAPEPEIREAAVTAANFLKWDMLTLALEAIIESDDLHDLRELAARSLREIRRYVHALELVTKRS
jgi:hypothetical protein